MKPGECDPSVIEVRRIHHRGSRSDETKGKLVIIIIIIIIITRPRPAFGRLGLGGSSGGYSSHG